MLRKYFDAVRDDYLFDYINKLENENKEKDYKINSQKETIDTLHKMINEEVTKEVIKEVVIKSFVKKYKIEIIKKEAHDDVKNWFNDDVPFRYEEKYGFHFGKIELHDFIDKLFDKLEDKEGELTPTKITE